MIKRSEVNSFDGKINCSIRKSFYTRNPIVETTGCKPKPTAYEKYLILLFAYCMFICCTNDLTTSFFGGFNVNTPLTYFASIAEPSVFSSNVKDLLNER